jgi:NAD(P)-dependent dehydrogenase (short-subunit alcohol dehydrogenase family)
MSSLDFGLNGVHVLITGASGGIGLSLVEVFHSLGAKISAQYNTSLRGLDKYSTDGSSGVVPLEADVSSEEAVKSLFRSAESTHQKPVQVLVVNHGVFPSNDIHLVNMELGQWRNTLGINLDGNFLLCREFLRRLDVHNNESGKGPSDDPAINIIFIGSTAGKFGEAGHADYASSKSAIMAGLMLSLKNEIVQIASKGRVNTVSPGWVATAMAAKLMADEKLKAKALATTPLQKVAQPIDVARQVAVVASPVLGGHLSGVNIMVDGGMEGRCLYPPPQ